MLRLFVASTPSNIKKASNQITTCAILQDCNAQVSIGVCRQLQWIGALGPISVASLSISAVYLGNLQQRAGIAVVGSITGGLPEMTAGWWLPMDNFSQLVATAVVISFVSLLESISIARALAEPQQDVLHPLNPNQELLGEPVLSCQVVM